jgi:hypothetical protein
MDDYPQPSMTMLLVGYSEGERQKRKCLDSQTGGRGK